VLETDPLRALHLGQNQKANPEPGVSRQGSCVNLCAERIRQSICRVFLIALPNVGASVSGLGPCVNCFASGCLLMV
jgi:hypothetical protein